MDEWIKPAGPGASLLEEKSQEGLFWSCGGRGPVETGIQVSSVAISCNAGRDLAWVSIDNGESVTAPVATFQTLWRWWFDAWRGASMPGGVHRSAETGIGATSGLFG